MTTMSKKAIVSRRGIELVDTELFLPDPATLATQARAKRNTLLAASDWTQVADAPVDQAAWATYRRALRDVPDQAGFPTDINWPVAPE